MIFYLETVTQLAASEPISARTDKDGQRWRPCSLAKVVHLPKFLSLLLIKLTLDLGILSMFPVFSLDMAQGL